MANETVNVHLGDDLAWVADVAVITRSEEFGSHVIGIDGNTGTVTLEWSKDGSRWFPAEATTDAEYTFYHAQFAPFLRVVRTADAEGTYYHY